MGAQGLDLWSKTARDAGSPIFVAEYRNPRYIYLRIAILQIAIMKRKRYPV